MIPGLITVSELVFWLFFLLSPLLIGDMKPKVLDHMHGHLLPSCYVVDNLRIGICLISMIKQEVNECVR